MAKDAKREALGDLKKMLSSGLGKRLAAKHAPRPPAPPEEEKGKPAALHVTILKAEPAPPDEAPAPEGEPDADEGAEGQGPVDLKSLISKHLDGLLPRRKR